MQLCYFSSSAIVFTMVVLAFLFFLASGADSTALIAEFSLFLRTNAISIEESWIDM